MIDDLPGGCIINLGKTNSGKSNNTKYLILKYSTDIPEFQFGIVFCGTKFNHGYSYLPDEYVFDGYQEDVLRNYMQNLRKWREKNNKPPPKNFVIFDDLVGVLDTKDKYLTHLHTLGRHTSTFFIHNIQYIKAINPTIRENVELVYMYRSKTKNTIEALYENFGQTFDRYNDFKNFFLNSLDKFQALLYIQNEDDDDKNYQIYKAPDMTDIDIKLNY